MRKLNKKIRQIIRVNHAGELGAQKIYNSQIKFSKNQKLKKKLEKIALEEKEHFDYFNAEILKNRVRPTVMTPVWNLFGTALGIISSRLGEEYVNACTESVEEVIVEHYKKQISFLEKSKTNIELKRKIKKFCDDENLHREDAVTSGDSGSLGVHLFKKITKAGTQIAIEISKRI